ncbi:proline--tRNA ligase [Microlunatus parietis]|uniref:Proline--tRNA ligase n=1 Tax=Microlunatus parietis TaxID=682979 RepID=A0A7Y9L8M9_9ACTN|nr:proline--tRNA ligase [Microlunatus parietis]NYE70934.1 prolyl-tRNA synthetase [Microlunatus parietis]
MARTVLTPREQDFPQWYQDVIAKAELAENGPVRGTMVIRPWGYAIWERMQAAMDARIKAAGARNAYFPLFIPESYLNREADHVEGFSPELAVVTHAGGKQLEEPIIVRPTSETMIGEFMAKWISSHRDLPLLLNQWANVVRWELRSRIFLRTTEFLWQEGHTAHTSEAEARAYARRILLDAYADFLRIELAIPVVPGRKTRRERFAGAVNTMTVEGMMGDGKALQLGTSHEFGQNFAQAFDITFTDAEQQSRLAWTTSWGSSTRMLGGMIMCHGDDDGLRLPPRVAPVQAMITVIKDGDGAPAAVAAELVDGLSAAGVRVELDDRTDLPYGRRAVDHELKGIPVRVEIGPRDLVDGQVTLVRRALGIKTPCPVADVVSATVRALADDHDQLLTEAERFRDDRTADVTTVGDAIEAARSGWARIPWRLLGETGEDELAAQGVTVRCLVHPDGRVPDTDDAAAEPDLVAIAARAY